MRYIGFIFALCLSIQAIASNTITLSSVSGTPQTEVEVVVSLDNTDAITALELNIPLGEHLSYVDGSTVLASSRSNGHLLTATQVQQELRICVYSLNLSALQGNNGELLSFRLKLGNEPATYTLTPSVILSDARGQSLDSNVQSGQVSILAPKLEILNPQIDYGHIPIRETYTQDLQLYNAGNLPLIIEDIVVNDPAFTPAQTALTIEVGEVAYTTIHYAPTVRGAIQKEVVVTSNAINGKQMGTIVADPFSVNELHVVGGSGIADNAVTISLKMNNMEPIVGIQCTFVLPEQLEYIAGSLSASSRSNGHQALASVKKFVEKENQWYDSKGDTLVLMLYSMANQPLNGNDGEIATFQVRLNGNSGSYALTPRDVILTNATAENMVSATYKGWVEIQSPQFSGDDYLSFGDWSITDDIVANYVVRNYGDASLEIERVTFLAQGYRVVSTMPLQINPWEKSTIQIAYDPAAEGDFSTTMNIYTNDPSTRMKAVAVSGHVYEPNTLSMEGARMQDGSYQLAISLDNYTNIVGVQYDIHWRSDMTTSQAAFTPTARLQNHTYAIMPIGQNTYRVLIYSLTNTPITGKEGELHQLLFTPQGDVNYCDNTITIDNIVLSNVTGTDKVSQSTVLHHLPTTQYSEQTITACDQYAYNNKVYQSSGTYIDTLQTIGGCDSIVTTYLTINHSEREEYYETACDEFYWDHNGETYYESGDYEYYTITEQGCERVEVLHLTIFYSEHEEYNVTACDSYEWNGETYTESGDYEYYTTNEYGCERTEVLHLTIFYSEHEEYNVTACDSYEWHGETYTESGDYEYRTTITPEKLYVGYNAQNDPIIGLTPPRGVSKFTVDGFITEGSGACFVGTGTPVDEEADNSDLRIFDAGCFYYDRMSGRKNCFFDDFREPFNIEFGNYYAKNLETGEYYFNEGNNVYEYSNTEYPLTLFYNDYGKIHKVQFFDNNNLLWADINAVIEGGLPMIKIDYYEADGTIYHTQKFTENLYAERKNDNSISLGCERVEVLHLTINRSEREEYNVTACNEYWWHNNQYTESGDYEYYTTTDQGCERVEILHLTINLSEREEYWETACEEYEWHDHQYTESGDYEYYTTTDQGCERVEILHLTINRSEREEYWETACDVYEWHGEVYTESGTYEYHTTTEQGCERVEVLHIIINHSEREEYYETACDEFYWDHNGETYYESGDYEYYTTTDQGCERVEVLHVTINRSEYEEFNATSCDSYEWHGQVYTASGDYEYRTTTEQGCERLEVLHLTINRSEREEFEVSACDSYEWHGQVYTASGDYEYRTTTEQGCERLELLHLTINRSEREEFEISACDSYEWHGQVYTASGDYEYRTTTADGCESLEVLHLTINRSEYEEYYVTVCDSYEWHGEVYREAGDYTYETTTTHGCQRTEVLHLTLSEIEHEEFTVSTCEEYWWHDTQYTESGDYEYYTTTDEGCERVEILHLTINRSEYEEIEVSACDSYEWHGNTYYSSGTYEHYTTTEHGCERVEVLYLTINHSEYEEYWETACDEYFWDRDGNTYYDSGDYEHYTTTEQGCERVEVLHLTINKSEREEYTATACDQYEWHGQVYTESGDYEYRTTTSEGCERLEVLHLTINRSEREEFNVSACESYEWHGNTYYDSGTYEHYTTTDAGCERVEVLHLTIHHSEYEEYYVTVCDSYEWHGEVYREAGDYTYETTTAHGCQRTEVLHLTLSDSEYEEYNVTACDQYEWHGEVYTESGDYTFNTISSSGCERTEVLHLTIFYSEHEEYNVTACDSYEWHGETFTESGDYEYRTTIEETTEKLYVGYDAQNDPIIGLTPPRGISRFTVDGYITQGAGTCFVGTGTPVDEEADNSDLRIFDAGCLYYDRMSGRNSCFFYDYREPFNIEFGNYYAKNLETGEYYFNEGNNVYEYSNTEYPLTLFYNDYGKIHKVQFFDNNNLLWADINAVIEGEVPMITIDYYNQDGSIYHTQQFTENLHAETKTITEQGCERVEVLHLTINHSEREEYSVTECNQYEWHGQVYTESGDYEYRTTTEHGCERVEILHLTINRSEREEYYEYACDSYEWHGQVYTESGDYEYRSTLENGCERVEVLHLTIYNSQYEEYWETACDAYGWWGNIYTESGDYTYSYVIVDWGSGYCERTEVLHLTINKRDTVHYYETACDEYWWDPYGYYYNTSGDYEHYTTNEYGCERVEVLHLTINRSEREEYWENACDTYEWHDQTYTESGDYEYRTTLENGCERVEVLHLTIYNSQYEEYWETACDEYYWYNGERYTESGDYTYSYPIYNWGTGTCDRTEVLHLTINKSEREEYWATACDEYYWDRNGNTYYDSGDYEHYTTTEQGCERVEVLHLTINRSEREEYWINACDAYEWHGETYTQSGNYEYRSTLENGCERVEVLHLTIYNSQYEEYWETACDAYGWWGNTYTESGDYTYSYVIADWGSGYCERTEVLHLTINKSEREEYWATACDEYYWDRNGNTYYSSGDYEHYTTTEQGCERVEVLHLTINRSEREEYWINACDAYEWHGETYTQSGNYEYRSTLENGCERVEVLHLTIYNSQYEEYWETACDEYYWWNGERYTESGDYTYSYPLYNWGTGTCDRTEVLHLTINKRDTVHYYETACDEYWWNPYGQYYNTSGDYEYYTTNEYGCERVEILHLTINHSEHQEYYENACDAYEWYGNTYTESGDYEYRTTTEHGCERVEILHLTINRSIEVSYEVTACDSYTWSNGVTYTQSGVYYDSLKTIHGCDSVEILTLTINYSDTAYFSATACDSYVWHDETYTTSGTYEYLTQTVNGCDSLEVLTLTINRSVTSEETYVSCDSYTWNGETYTESGDYVYTTVAANGCDSIVTLHLTILPDATTETEELALCPSELPYEWFGQSLSEAGTYSATEPYVGMECDSVIHELTLNVYVQTLPATVTLPIVRMGEAIDVTIPTAEIQAHIAAETWYAPNALVAWYIMENSDWAALSADPVAAGIVEVTLKYAVETDCGNIESDKMVIAVETTGLENIPTDVMGVYKVLRDNKIFIIRGGKAYSIMGHLVGDKSVIDPAVTIQ